MALKINTNIENDMAGGYLVDGKAVKMATGQTLEEAVAQRPPVKVVEEMPDTPEDGVLYIVLESEA